MPSKKEKPKTTRSRTVSRTRSVSRNRAASKKRSVSRSPSRKSVAKTKTPASESKVIRRRSPSSSSDESTSKIASRKTNTKISSSRPGVRASMRIIEKIESSHIETKSSSSPPRVKSSVGLLNRLKGHGHSACCRTKNFLLSQGLASFNTIITIPLFVFWIVFLIVSPTSKKAFDKVSTEWGAGVAFGGAAWPTELRSYFDPYVLVGVVMFYKLVGLIALLVPFGKRLTVMAGGRRTEIKANCLFVMILFMACTVALQYKLPEYVPGFSLSKLCKYWPTIMTGAWINAFYVAVIAYWRSRNIRRSSVNSNRLTGNLFVDFCIGREIRPQLMGLDLKLFIFYPALIGLRILEIAVVLRQFEHHKQINPAMATVMLLHGVGILDLLVFEQTLLNSFGMTHDGFGLERIQRFFLVLPFMRLLVVLYLGYNFDAGYPNVELASCGSFLIGMSVLIFLVGLVIRRCSANQKYLFSRDPQHPSFDNIDKIPTSSGRRILAGGWWGRVRQPNYIGEILMTFACSLPAGFTSPIPWITPVLVTLALLVHTCRVERTCAEKYGPGWEKYTASVPYRFIPRIY